MRFLFTLQPGIGHLYPLAPLARTLQDAGHEIRMATAHGFLPAVAAAGLEGMAAGRDWLESEAVKSFPDFLDRDAGGQTRLFAELGPEFFDDLWGAEGPPDLVVRETVEFSGAFYAARLGIPCVTHGITMRPPLPLLELWAGEALRALAAHAGVDGGIEVIERGIAVNHMPECWVPEGLPQLEGERFFAPCENLPSPDPGPEWLQRRDRSRPLVYGTLGTVFNGENPIFDAMVAAATGEPYDLLMTVGHNGDPDRYPATPNVHVTHFVDQERILGEAAAVVCHGGMGTVMGSLRHGVPLCILPLSADQPFNALRCAALGSGRSYATVDPPGAPPFARPGDIEAGVLREHVRALLDDRAYAKGASRLAEEIAALPGLEDEAAFLVALAAGDRR